MLKSLFNTEKLSTLLPPNMAAQQVEGWITDGLTLELLGCLNAFAMHYCGDYNRLFVYRNGQRVLRQDAYALEELDQAARPDMERYKIIKKETAQPSLFYVQFIPAAGGRSGRTAARREGRRPPSPPPEAAAQRWGR